MLLYTFPGRYKLVRWKEWASSVESDLLDLAQRVASCEVTRDSADTAIDNIAGLQGSELRLHQKMNALADYLGIQYDERSRWVKQAKTGRAK